MFTDCDLDMKTQVAITGIPAIVIGASAADGFLGIRVGTLGVYRLYVKVGI